MKKFLISSVVASTLLSTASLAAISTDGTGEFLIAPQYFANDGFSTDLKLVNTSAQYSYIYRAVIREYNTSEELDFVIMLSPLDVWTASIVKKDDGYYLVSDDDSNYESNSINFNITAENKFKRSFEKGYVEFYPMVAYDETTTEDTAKPVSKTDLRAKVKALVDVASGNGNASGGVVVKREVGSNNAFVSGFVTLKNTNLKASMTLPMTAFVGVNKLGSPELAFDKIGLTKETKADTYLATDGVKEVYKDLNVSKVTVPYENFGVNDGLYFTFWNDGWKDDTHPEKVQERTYNYLIRDHSENGKNIKNYFSGTTQQEFKILHEMGSININELLQASKLNEDGNYTNGMVKVYNLKSTDNTKQKTLNSDPNLNGQPAALVTYMSARYIDGKPSYSWTYAPVAKK